MSQGCSNVRFMASTSNPINPIPIYRLWGWRVPELTSVGSLRGTTQRFFFFPCPYELSVFEYSGLWQTVLQRTQNNKDLNTTRCSAVLLDGLSWASALPQIVALLAEGRAPCLLVCHQSLQTDSQRGSNPSCQRATLQSLSIVLCGSADLEAVKNRMNDNWVKSSEQGS